MLQCPKCKGALHKENKVYRCEHNHSFDISKRGYCNVLLGNHKATGDDAEMVKARTNFLNSGYYAPLKDRLIDLIATYHPSIFVDAGCGEGYYTNAIQSAYPNMELYGFDLSKTAVDAACKAHTNAYYFVASIHDLPCVGQSIDMVLSIFAPISENENARILKDKGIFIKVGPGPKHLEQLKSFLYEKVYDNEESIDTYEAFQQIHEELIDYKIDLASSEDIQSLFHMTPYYWRTPKEAVGRLYRLDTFATRIQFCIEVYEKI